ncbi:Hsp20/alpha crystallin family protein [Cognatitamlana onchidii]|uniref:Hsp20/alpha crystallin family protein n=1 Tax=Cognatitamlana onchidii TaxID=2562860 RepID=UPI0010A65E38|nr:Hsp20/alpha crystallin family protein [Algibacter onchidii]
MSTLIKHSHNGNNGVSRSNYPLWSNWIDDMFNPNEFSSVLPQDAHSRTSLPKVNIKETKNEYVIDIAVPGMNKSDFKIDLDNGVLSISAEQKDEQANTNENYTRKEFTYSSFKRTFTLADSIDESKISAKYKDGILGVTLPKKEEAKEKPIRSIKIS